MKPPIPREKQVKNTNGGVRRRSLEGRSKVEEVCGRLTELAHELGPDAKFPTVLQLCERLNVSNATLNVALTQLETRRVVLRRHGVGIYVASRLRQKNLCLICTLSSFMTLGSSPFWTILVDRLRRRVAEAEEELTFCLAADNPLGLAPAIRTRQGAGGQQIPVRPSLLPDALAADIAAGRVDGVFGVGLDDEAVITWIEERGVPTVVFAGPGRAAAISDGQQLIRLGVAELARQGCRRIGMWAPSRPGAQERVPPVVLSENHRCFREQLAQHGLPYEPALVREGVPAALREAIRAGARNDRALTNHEQGYWTAKEYFGGDETTEGNRLLPPDGLLSMDDMMTLGMLAFLRKAGVRIGQDLRIASHANVDSPALLGWEDELTLIEFDAGELADRMFEMLVQRIEGIPEGQRFAIVPPRLRTDGSGR